MIIKEGSVKEIHNWFLTEETDEIVLCVFLCANPENVSMLSETIERAFQVDAAIGREIGFLLTARELNKTSSIDAGGGQCNIIGADYVAKKGTKQIARDFISQFDMDHLRNGGQPAARGYYQAASDALARSSASLVPEFMEYYGVRYGELPCIVTLVKGIEEVGITRCPQDINSDQLIAWMRKIAEIISAVQRELILRDFSHLEICSQIARTAELEREKSAKLDKIAKAVTGICKKQGVDQGRASTLVASLSSSDLSSEEKKSLIQDFCRDHTNAAEDNRWPKIRSLQERVDEICESMISVLDRDSLRDLDQKLRLERDGLESLFKKIRSVEFDGLQPRMIFVPAVPRRASSSWDRVERVNTAVDIGQKINSAISYVVRLLAVGS